MEPVYLWITVLTCFLVTAVSAGHIIWYVRRSIRDLVRSDAFFDGIKPALREHEQRIKAVETEWADWYNKNSRLAGRISKHASMLKKAGGTPDGALSGYEIDPGDVRPVGEPGAGNDQASKRRALHAKVFGSKSRSR